MRPRNLLDYDYDKSKAIEQAAHQTCAQALDNLEDNAQLLIFTMDDAFLFFQYEQFNGLGGE